jgi:hypothetical protein
MEIENKITCMLFDQKLKKMCKFYPITYFEDDFEKIRRSMLGLCIHASKGYIGVDMPSLYSMSSFSKIGKIENKLVIRDENEREITDILVVPKRMIVHIDDDIRKNYIMLMSNKGERYNKGIDSAFFEHITDLEGLLDKEESAKRHDALNVYEENYPILVHPLESAYNIDNYKKDLLFLSLALDNPINKT